MMASVFGGAKLTPVLRTPEANPFADTEPMGKYRRSARAGRLYLTTRRAQHCFPRRSFPVMISLLNLYGALGEKRAAEAPRRGAGWYKDPALRCYYEGRGSELWCNQHQLRQPEGMAVALRPSHPARRQQQPIFVPDSPVVSIQRKCTVRLCAAVQ